MQTNNMHQNRVQPKRSIIDWFSHLSGYERKQIGQHVKASVADSEQPSRPIEPIVPKFRRGIDFFDYSKAKITQWKYTYYEDEKTLDSVGKDGWIPLALACAIMNPNTATRQTEIGLDFFNSDQNWRYQQKLNTGIPSSILEGRECQRRRVFRMDK